MTDSPSTIGSRRHWTVFRFGIFSVIIPVILGAIVGLFYAGMQPVQYTANATVRVGPQVSLSGIKLLNNAPDMPTEQQIAASAAVAKLARSALGTSANVTDLQKHLTVTATSTGHVLVITYTSSSPTLAARYANALAKAYVSYRNRPLNELTYKEKHDIALLIGQIPHSGTVLRVARVAQLREDETLLRQLEGAAQLSPGGSVISAATPPSSPSSPKTARDVALGLAAGLVAGICLSVQRVAYRYLERHRSPG
jgi:uncharacterized protein involved in exopolysaccharide biosynthesis